MTKRFLITNLLIYLLHFVSATKGFAPKTYSSWDLLTSINITNVDPTEDDLLHITNRTEGLAIGVAFTTTRPKIKRDCILDGLPYHRLGTRGFLKRDKIIELKTGNRSLSVRIDFYWDEIISDCPKPIDDLQVILGYLNGKWKCSEGSDGKDFVLLKRDSYDLTPPVKILAKSKGVELFFQKADDSMEEDLFLTLVDLCKSQPSETDSSWDISLMVAIGILFVIILVGFCDIRRFLNRI